MLSMIDKKTAVIQKWTLLAVSVLVPIWLFFAHLDQGADTQATTAIYSIGLIIVFAILILSSGLEAVSTGMVIISGIFLAWLALGLFGNWPMARTEVQGLAAAGAVTGIGYIIGKHPNAFRTAWSSLNWSLLLFSLLALFVLLSDGNSITTSEADRFDGRLTAVFGSPNTAATLFGLAVLLAASRILLRLSHSKMTRLSRRDRIYYFTQSEYASFGLLILAGICLLLTMSRAGIFISMTCLVGLVIVELTRLSRTGRFKFIRKRTFQIPFGLVLVLALVLAVTGEINPYDPEPLLENSSSRMIMYETYTSIWLERPFFGHGMGSFNALNDSHTTLNNAAHLVTAGAAHNVVLQWLIQQGIVGLTIMALVVGLIIYPIIQSLRQGSSVPRHFLRMALAATILVFAHGMFDYALEIPSVMWTYAFILGLASGFAASTLATKSQSDE